MKKIIPLVLVLAMALALCACGEPQIVEKEVEKTVEVPVVPDEWLKYQDLFDALESENYDAAQAVLDAMKPVPETPPIVEVKITRDNFFDYFEYLEIPEFGETVTKDSAGNPTAVTFYSGYYLKDGYTVAEEKEQDCAVEAGVKFNFLDFWDNRGITVDLENRAYTVTGRPSTIDKMDYMTSGYPYRPAQDAPLSYVINVGSTSLSLGKDSTSIIIDSLELVSASGTLYLYG